MHLMEILADRSVLGGGVFLSLTRRCPLSCDHCSTRSELTSEESDAEPYRRFVASFTPEDHPGTLVLTGGEPLLRPSLVRELANTARAAGTRVAIISGMFFARQPRLPPAIDEAIGAVDHLIASLDAFHDQEVPRAAVLRTLEHVRRRGIDVSVQLAGFGPDDPYLTAAIHDIRRTFDDEVPMLVAEVHPVGRAATWLPAPRPVHREVAPNPCTMAAWPVVAFDGTVVACCNQRAIDGPTPEHLRLGHIGTDGWPAVRARHWTDPTLRGIRTFGPRYLDQRFSDRPARCSGECDTCLTLSREPDRPALRELVAGPSFAVTEGAVTSLLGSIPLQGTVAGTAHLSALGWRGSVPCPT
jgi:pyruvate-formate lyase-activating enzyme